MKIMESPLAKNIIAQYNFEFGDLFVFEDFLVSEIHEGENLDYEKTLELLNAILIFSEEKTVVNFITNRVCKYSVDLTAYIKARVHFKKHTNFAHVNYNPTGEEQSKFEVAFLKCTNTKLFNSLEQAALWFSKPAQLS